MQIDTLRELYVEELKDLYNAEKQLIKALPKMARNATNPRLRAVFSEHLSQTRTHLERLERIFSSLDASPRGKKCVGMEGIIREGDELLQEDAQEDVLDAGLIAKAQHVEHYEIAGYGTVRSYAITLGETEHARLLQQTLSEEERTDRLLTGLAESSINVDAAIGGPYLSRRTRRAEHADREVARAVTAEGAVSGRRSVTGRKQKSRTTTREARAR